MKIFMTVSNILPQMFNFGEGGDEEFFFNLNQQGRPSYSLHLLRGFPAHSENKAANWSFRCVLFSWSVCVCVCVKPYSLAADSTKHYLRKHGPDIKLPISVHVVIDSQSKLGSEIIAHSTEVIQQ